MAEDLQSGNRSSAAAERSPKDPHRARNAAAAAERRKDSRFFAKLRFFRAILWVLVYATAGLFLMSVILLDGLRLQSKVIGAALLLVLLLIAATYGLQWYG